MYCSIDEKIREKKNAIAKKTQEIKALRQDILHLEILKSEMRIEDTAGQYAHIVGNGLADTFRRNAHTLDWSGNAWFAGDVANGNGVSLDSLKAMLDDALSGAAIEVPVMTYEETMAVLEGEEAA